ncbi:ROK family protein [Subtercola sp. YIM 133946]|uniref:ROK family protein n=1 Tax=Subtercola sp. YIM 133946 TaxID=3118909 RepID=UPI002F942D64
MRIGIDIGGTKTDAVVITDDGQLTERIRLATGFGAEQVVQSAVDAVELLLSRTGLRLADARSIGIGIPGTVDSTSGHVSHAVNLGFDTLDLGDALEDRLGVRVRIENDVKAAAIGAYSLLSAERPLNSRPLTTPPRTSPLLTSPPRTSPSLSPHPSSSSHLFLPGEVSHGSIGLRAEHPEPTRDQGGSARGVTREGERDGEVGSAAPHSMAYLNLGTGLAAGLVIDGELWRGSWGAAGEIGHIPIDPAGALCPCGQRGCLETVASGSGITRQWQTDAALPAQSLFAAAAAGDLYAVDVRDRFIDGIASAVRILVLTVDVDTVVIGGGLSNLGVPLLDAVTEVLAGWASSSPFIASLDLARRVELLPTGFPAAAVGAALVGVETQSHAPSIGTGTGTGKGAGASNDTSTPRAAATTLADGATVRASMATPARPVDQSPLPHGELDPDLNPALDTGGELERALDPAESS